MCLLVVAHLPDLVSKLVMLAICLCLGLIAQSSFALLGDVRALFGVPLLVLLRVLPQVFLRQRQGVRCLFVIEVVVGLVRFTLALAFRSPLGGMVLVRRS